ncbi:peptidoglycan-binding protein [Methylobacterium sp. E-005]|uniref:peptidoglycan-binding domain-containing protein n=1 Tax=Methylobacterium sp. E-005 TaxID=2836549 RepID=UPI001FBC01F1|nr:peptidoglycan-binding domain-containing protein [Methylobacterium sp. E-005]MCJ2088354.1 peptidoglycan-binding protein [Methylobacterium sp. E-005]
MAVAHREYCTPKGRKIDPAGIDMTAFRLRVAGAMNGGVVRALIPKVDAQKRPTLRRGASGPDVIALQNAIGVKADGQFGPGTESALRAYQRAHHLVADGICGPACWAAIDSVRAAA